MPYMQRIRVHYMVLFLLQPELRGGNQSGTTPNNPHDPLAKFLLPVPMNLCSNGLEVLVPKGGMFLPGDNDSTELEVNTAVSHFGHHTPLNQQAKKRVIVLDGVTDPDYQRQLGLLLHRHHHHQY